MQLKKKSIRGALAAATCTLLGAASFAMADTAPVEFDTAMLYYKETDRISVMEAVLNGTKEFGDEKFLNLKLQYDSITGASPNGASAASTPQTFTSPSGESTYTSKAGETPLNSNFMDERISLSTQWTAPYQRLTKGSFGANASYERDYLSFGLNTSWSRDFNKRNTTLSGGLSLEYDMIRPEGGAPIEMELASSTQRQGSEKTKQVYDALLGVTQVFTRGLLMQLNYSLGKSNGFHTDPYKIISVVNATTGDTTTSYINERRPENRLRQSLFWQAKYHLTKDIIDLSYRFYLDDWGVRSHTVDFLYRFHIPWSSYLEPHVRIYSQSAADFYVHSLVIGFTPEDASADYRLGDFFATTFGLKFSKELSGTKELSARLEFYRITGDSSPGDAIGSQKNQDLFPTVEAFITQLIYSF